MMLLLNFEHGEIFRVQPWKFPPIELGVVLPLKEPLTLPIGFGSSSPVVWVYVPWSTPWRMYLRTLQISTEVYRPCLLADLNPEMSLSIYQYNAHVQHQRFINKT